MNDFLNFEPLRNPLETELLLIEAAAAAVERAMSVASDHPNAGAKIHGSASREQEAGERQAADSCLKSIVSLLEITRRLLVKPADLGAAELKMRRSELTRCVQQAGSVVYDAALILSDSRARGAEAAGNSSYLS